MEVNRRQQRMTRAIRDIISEALMNDISDPRMKGFVNITAIDLSPDLRYASIYLRCFGVESDSAKRQTFLAIDHARGHIQTKLASELNVKFCPVITFHEDEKQEKVNEMLKLIKEVSKEFKDEEPEEELDQTDELS